MLLDNTGFAFPLSLQVFEEGLEAPGEKMGFQIVLCSAISCYRAD